MRKNPRFRPGVLRQARAAAGYSRPELAGLVGVSPATVKAWETGRRTPAPSAMARLAEVLGVELQVAAPADAADLTDLRERLGFTRELAAEHLGISTGALAEVEAGLALPPDPVKMARLYGVSAEVLAAVTRRTGG